VPLGILLDMIADTWPDRVVVGTAESGWSAAELRRTAAAGAASLIESGARSVAFLDVNGPDFVVALWSALLAGLPFCPLNYRLSGEQLIPLVAALDDPLILGRTTYRSLLPDGVRFANSERFVASAHASRHNAPVGSVADSALAILLFTSGTTAKPKAVAIKHEHLVSYVLETVDFATALDQDAILVCMPPYHIAGVNAVLTNLYSGRRMVHLPNFEPAAWLQIARSERITHAMVVPTMLARLTAALDGKPANVPALRHLAYGGARTPRPVLEAALRAFPQVDFVNAYGLTETSSTIAVLGPRDHRLAMTGTAADQARLGSVGQLVPGIEAEIRDETSAALPAGRSGELWLRGRQISGTYLGQGSVLDANGWFPTRDRARFDEDGFLYIEGRADDTIIRGGENIAPAEIEEALAAHPDIADVAVVGLPDAEWGERIVAAVVLQPQAHLDEAQVRAFARHHLRGSRTPDVVVFVTSLPYNATGKLVRRELTAQLTTSDDH
jgi:acyl-CoA synthetase (AMP-forming)/AMP-acid ligase II